MLVKQKFWFSLGAAHYLPNYLGDCGRLHGHTWKILVEIMSKVDQKSGLAEDFKDFKELIRNNVISKYDHYSLNELLGIPTAENFAYDLFHCVARLKTRDRKNKWDLVAVEVWESADCGVRYEG